MYIKHLFLDMDDTLTNTDRFLKSKITDQLISEGDQTKLIRWSNWLKERLTTLQLPEEFKNYSFKYGLKEGKFMIDVLPSQFMGHPVLFRNVLEDIKALGVEIHVCSHRGWHSSAETLTRSWLQSQGLLSLITDVIMLDSGVAPNKLAYLEEHYQDFAIVDDNPCHNINKLVPHDPRLLVVDQTTPYPAYVEQLKVRNIREVLEFIRGD